MINRFFDNELLQRTFFGNPIHGYIDVFIYFVIVLIVLFILQKFILSRLSRFAQKTSTDIDDVVVEFIKSIKPRLYVVLSLYFTLSMLVLSEAVQDILNIIVIIIIIFQVTLSIQIIIEFVAKKIVNDETDEHAKSAAHLLGAIATIVIWFFGILMILSNVGINVSSLIAGVGIGGIAIAFAIKEILSDLFSSFSIYFDKPFKAGDVIKIGDELGEVKKIGIKTTRIKSRTGEELIISNQDLTSSRLHNYKRMDSRNARFKFIVEFDTPKEKLKQIPIKIEEIISKVDNAKCSRVHLKDFGEWGFIFEIVYIIESRDYVLYRDVQQEINIEIAQMLEDMSVILAVPEKR